MDTLAATPSAPRDAAMAGRAVVAFGVLGFAFWRSVSDYATRDLAVGGFTYRVGDWLISYAGGFVRRGLFGELLFAASPPGSTLLVLAGFQLACYAVVLAYAFGFVRRTGYAWPAIALVAGPAALGFVGWDVEGGWRKEIICFAAIALLGWARRTSRPRGRLALTIGAVALFGLAVFSWEAAVVTLPVMLYLLRRDDDWPDLRSWPSLSLLGLGLVGGLAGLLAPVSKSTVAAVCHAAVAEGADPVLCDGAIRMLGQSLPDALAAVAVRFPLYWWFLALLPLALLPVLTSPWLRRHWRWFAATALLVLPLYVIAEDYGRWAHLLAMAAGLAIMAGDLPGVASRFWNAATTIAYTTVWGLPHWLFPDDSWPWLGLLPALFDHPR